MKKRDFSGWSITLVALTFVAIPAFVLFYFLMPDWNPNALHIKMWQMLLIALGFVFYTITINLLFIYLKILKVKSLTFIVPIAISLMIIFISFELHIWLRLLLATLGMLTVIPMNIAIDKFYSMKNNSSQH